MKLKQIELALIFLFGLSLTFAKRHIFFDNSLQLNGSFLDLGYFALYISDLTGILLLGVLLMFQVQQPKSFTTWKPLLKSTSWPIWALSILLTLSLLISPRGEADKLLLFARLIIYFLIFSYFSSVSRDRPALLSFLYSITIGSILQCAIAVTQFVNQKSVGLSILGESTLGRSINGVAKFEYVGSKFIRSYGTFEHPNQLAAFAVVACATSIYLYITNKEEGRRGEIAHIIALLGIISSIFTVFLTFSRGGIFTLGLTTLVYIVYVLYKRTFQSQKILIFTIFSSIIVVATALSPFLTQRATLSDVSTEKRLEYNQIGLEAIKDRPFLGTGMGYSLPEIQKIGQFKEIWQIQPPHNYFILFATENGPLSLLALIIIIVLIIKRLVLKKTPESIFVLSVLIIILVLMQFDHYFYTLEQTSLLFIAFAGIGYGLGINLKKN